MSSVEAGPHDFFNLEARGFGCLTGPAWSPRACFRADDEGERFSYFTYKIDAQEPRRDTWALHSTDLIWAFCKVNAFEQSGPCILRLYERGVPAEPKPSNVLVRHWCPILFDDELVNK